MTSPNRKQHIAPQIRRIILVGVGGTGSYLAQGLAKLIAGYRLQVEVVLADPDTVEEKNCARQNFHHYEIGENKAGALAYRLNQQYGLNFAGSACRGEELLAFAANGSTRPSSSAFVAGKSKNNDMSRLIITCVDTIAARKHYKGAGPWLDLGNGLETGQALYGTTAETKDIRDEALFWDNRPSVGHLPSPWLLTGMAKLKDSRKKTTGCADTPFAEQGIFTNEWAASAGLTILHQLLVKGTVTTPAIYFDSAKGRMSPEYITRDYLKRCI